MRYEFYLSHNKAKNRLYVSLALLLLALVPLGGLAVYCLGLKLTGSQLSIITLFPVALLQFLFIGVIIVLYRYRYRGSYLPLAALILLMGIGLVLQTRLTMNHSVLSQQNYSSYSIIQSATLFQEDSQLSFLIRGLGSYMAAYGISLFMLVCGVRFFSGACFERLSNKYMILFTATALYLSVFILLSHIVDGGKFFYSRVPWELAKISLPLSLAGFFADNSRFLHLFGRGKPVLLPISWGPFLLLTVIPLILFTVLGDFGQIMIYGCVILIMFYVATGSIIYPLVGLTAFLLIPSLLSVFTPPLPEYIADRWEIWNNFWNGFPSSEWWDRSYQTANALFALHAGGMGGTGLGLGYPELVPLSQSDFIFVEVAEELGFIGTLAIFLLYLSIITTGVQTAFQCTRRFDFLAVTALTLIFCCQVFINIGGVINFIPMTGIVLPFLSKGGFSLVTFSILVGFIMSVSHKNAVASAQRNYYIVT